MHLVVVMDPPSTVLVDEDTSFALMLQAQEEGHRVDHCQRHDLHVVGNRIHATVRRARMQRVAGEAIVLGEPEQVCLHDVDAARPGADPPWLWRRGTW